MGLGRAGESLDPALALPSSALAARCEHQQPEREERGDDEGDG
jgi:hypothetical protein